MVAATQPPAAVAGAPYPYSTVLPTMRYTDPAAAIKFLTEGLGFALHARFDGPGGTIMNAELFRGTGVIMIGPHPADGSSGAVIKPGAASTYVVVDADADVDAVFKSAVGLGASALQDPKDQPYGGRSATIRDIEGHYWSIGSYKAQPTAPAQ